MTFICGALKSVYRLYMKHILLILVFFFTHFSIAAAQAEVTLLSPLPDTGASEPFNTYLPIIFNLAIGISGVLAVIVIIIGGLQYMSTDAISGKSDGRNKITAALTGLVFVLAAYLILQTINPNLVRFSLPVVGVNVTRTAAPPTSSIYIGSGPTMTERNISARLTATNPYNQDINTYAGLYGIPTERIKSMMAIESAGRLGARSPAGALGLMQVLPSTAQGVLQRNPGLAQNFGVTDISDTSAISSLLLTNPEANIAIGTTYFQEGYARTGSLDDASARYNGGDDAIAPSVDCPGLKKYQCAINPGELQETINYINNIHAMESYLRTGTF